MSDKSVFILTFSFNQSLTHEINSSEFFVGRMETLARKIDSSNADLEVSLDFLR